MKLILVPQFGANNFDDVIIKYKANHMAIVPSYFKSVVNSEKLKNADLSYLIAPVVGGDAMEPSFEDEINSFLHSHGCKYKISKGYGMTEGSSGVRESHTKDGILAYDCIDALCNSGGLRGFTIIRE